MIERRNALLNKKWLDFLSKRWKCVLKMWFDKWNDKLYLRNTRILYHEEQQTYEFVGAYFFRKRKLPCKKKICFFNGVWKLSMK